MQPTPLLILPIRWPKHHVEAQLPSSSHKKTVQTTEHPSHLRPSAIRLYSSWSYTVQLLLQRWKNSPWKNSCWGHMQFYYTVQSWIATCKDLKKSLQSLQNLKPSCTMCNWHKQKYVARQVVETSATRCNPPATCLAMPLWHKLQRKLHSVTLVSVGFDSVLRSYSF